MTIEEYADAVHTLIKVVDMCCGGSRTAVQILLSAYNGDDFQLSIPDLCVLSPSYYPAAITVIRGRCELKLEPHEVIPDGSRIFLDMYFDWIGLHVQNRWKQRCPDCNGRGEKFTSNDSEEKIPCTRCEGRGKVAEVKWPERSLR
jgi:hypothetical protein